jgi:hypothetical protein
MTWECKTADLRKLFGILSLTPHIDNYLMWSHYGDSHTGFCVEFDTCMLVESIAGHFQQVDYTDEIPVICIDDTPEGNLLEKLIYIESKMWGYKDENRLSGIISQTHPLNLTRMG